MQIKHLLLLLLLRRAENNRSAEKGFLNASVALKVDKDLQMRL